VFEAVVALLICRAPWRWIDRFGAIPDLIERAGGAMTRVTPLFAFFVGIYVATLPGILSGYLARHPVAPGAKVRIAGASIDAASPRGILTVYLAIALATGAACAFWHLLLLLRVRAVIAGFSLRQYASQYLARIYPLLWATCSESLGTPVNLYLIGRLYPFTDARVRQFTVAVGSAINVNGTVLCCFVLTPAVCAMIGQPVSVVSLLLCLPVIYLIGFGVPGIPGELLLFAGPIAAVLQVPAAHLAAFTALFVALQFGLPDSFRSSGNSTDLCPAALLLDRARRRS
jgi:Na+/H+-dicarboxylate symporter